MPTIGERILAHRKARGWSRPELAKETAYSVEAIRLWEKDKNVPSEPSLRALELAFEIDSWE